MKTPKFKQNLFKSVKDEAGTLYIIPEQPVVRLKTGQLLDGVPGVEVWWDHTFVKKKNDELLFIRQETEEDRADVITLNLAQVYALIDALNHAVESR